MEKKPFKSPSSPTFVQQRSLPDLLSKRNPTSPLRRTSERPNRKEHDLDFRRNFDNLRQTSLSTRDPLGSGESLPTSALLSQRSSVNSSSSVSVDSAKLPSLLDNKKPKLRKTATESDLFPKFWQANGRRTLIPPPVPEVKEGKKGKKLAPLSIFDDLFAEEEEKGLKKRAERQWRAPLLRSGSENCLNMPRLERENSEGVSPPPNHLTSLFYAEMDLFGSVSRRLTYLHPRVNEEMKNQLEELHKLRVFT